MIQTIQRRYQRVYEATVCPLARRSTPKVEQSMTLAVFGISILTTLDTFQPSGHSLDVRILSPPSQTAERWLHVAPLLSTYIYQTSSKTGPFSVAHSPFTLLPRTTKEISRRRSDEQCIFQQKKKTGLPMCRRNKVLPWLLRSICKHAVTGRLADTPHPLCFLQSTAPYLGLVCYCVRPHKRLDNFGRLSGSVYKCREPTM